MKNNNGSFRVLLVITNISGGKRVFNVYRRFGRTHCLHLCAGDHNNFNATLLRNISEYPEHYTVARPTRQQSDRSRQGNVESRLNTESTFKPFKPYKPYFLKTTFVIIQHGVMLTVYLRWNVAIGILQESCQSRVYGEEQMK